MLGAIEADTEATNTVRGLCICFYGSKRKGRNNTPIDLATLQLCYTKQHDQPVLLATTRLVSL